MSHQYNINLLVGTLDSGDAYAFSVLMRVPVAGNPADEVLVGVFLPDDITKDKDISLQVIHTSSEPTIYDLGIYRPKIQGSIRDNVQELKSLEEKFIKLRPGSGDCRIGKISYSPEYEEALKEM